MAGPDCSPHGPRPWLIVLTLLGAFLTVRGYHCLDGDQAYRLPIMLHSETPALYRDDPFVRSFDEFNPHRGSFLVIGLPARAFGLPAGLGLLFVLTFLTSAIGIDRLARAVWPEAGPGVGLVAFALVLAALAGNIGTNHLFEPVLLDRQMAFALGWLALALVVESPGRGAWAGAVPLAGAALVHPTVGLQLALLIGSGWVVWMFVPKAGPIGRWQAIGALVLLALAVAPGLAVNLVHSGPLLEGTSLELFRRLSLELQGPQHMLPHLWRRPQWLAWACYPALGLVALASSARDRGPRALPPARVRLLVLLGLNLIGLGLAWYGIERLGHFRLTLFQPFRMATVCRGLCLVMLADHLKRLWERGGAVDRTRAALVLVGLAGDWMLVAVTLFEAVMTAADGLVQAGKVAGRGAIIARGIGWAILGLGVMYLSRHDTKSGHWPLLVVAASGLVGFGWLGNRQGMTFRIRTRVPLALPVLAPDVSRTGRASGTQDSRTGGGEGTPVLSLGTRPLAWTGARLARVAAVAWLVPVAAMTVQALPEGGSAKAAGWRASLVRRCRFGETPVDEVERLALWCRKHTPGDARFVGPPDPKTFRLWSRRCLAFNRAGSPYTARGLTDWAARFQDHVGFGGTVDDFVRAYLRDRHGLESGYDRKTGLELAELADRQGAGYVVARVDGSRRGPLELLHAEGAWGVYRRAKVPVAARASEEHARPPSR